MHEKTARERPIDRTENAETSARLRPRSQAPPKLKPAVEELEIRLAPGIGTSPGPGG